MLVGSDNIILGNRWNLQNPIIPIYYYEISSFNVTEVHKTYSLYKKDWGTSPSFFSQCIVGQIEVVMQQCGEKVRISERAFGVRHFGAR